MEDQLQGFEYPLQCFFERIGEWIIEEIKNELDASRDVDLRIDVDSSREMSERTSSHSLTEDLETASESDIDSDSELEKEIIPFVESEPTPNHLLNIDLLDKIFYQREGEIDGDSWIFLALHRDGYYVFFDYTEISGKNDNFAGGLVLYTKNPNDMYEFGFDSWTRDLIPNFLEQIELD
jgi:hypothetical protein